MASRASRSDPNHLSSVVLAAGDSKRMKSNLSKVLHPLAGLPMIVHVVRTLRSTNLRSVIVVVRRDRETIHRVLEGYPADLALQGEPLGTAHALLSARDSLKDFTGDLLVTCGDTPLLRKETLLDLIGYHRKDRFDATLLTCEFQDPHGYGRIVRGRDGTIQAIIEEREASESIRKIREINTGIYCFRSPAIFRFLEEICNEKTDREYYLTDIVERYNAAGLKVGGLSIADELEVMGINTRSQLARAESALRERIRDHWMKEGVTLIDPATILIDDAVRIGRDVTIYPFVIVEGATEIGEEAVIGPFCRIRESRIGKGVRLQGWNDLNETSIPEGKTLHPFASPKRE